MFQQQSNINTSLQSTKVTNPLITLFCLPCLKRGLMNKPAYVNLNEFQNNRYICESCSFGQTYIISLGNGFFSDKEKGVKLENRLKMSNQGYEKQGPFQNIEANTNGQLTSQKQNNPQIDLINLTQNIPQNAEPELLQDPIQLPQFVKNIQINSNPQSKYSIAEIDMYTENITHQYKQAMDVINNYQQMINSHIKKWKNKLKSQFQGAIGTFGNVTVGLFLKELKIMEQIERNIKILEEAMKQTRQNKNQQFRQRKNQENLSINIKTQIESFFMKNDIKSESNTQPSLSQLYVQSLNSHKIQHEKITLFVEALKMSGTRNLSNLKSLYNCCKGFSDAVKILISLQHKETKRRFDFISQKFKVCSIQTLYDAEMINGGYLDNRLEKPPGFDVVGQQIEKKKVENTNFKKVLKEDFHQSKKIEPQVLKQVLIFRSRENQIYHEKKVVDDSQQQKKKQKDLNHEISLISSQSQREQSIIQFPQIYKQDQKQLQILSQQKKSDEKLDPINKKLIKQEIIKNKILLQKQDDQQRLKMAKIRSKNPFKSGLLNFNLMERIEDQNKIRMEKQRQKFLIHGSQKGKQIDLENQSSEAEKKDETQVPIKNPNSPFPALRQLYQYQKGQNSFVSKLQLTQQNFQTFPPNDVYMPSVESLTIKYCPPVTDPLQLLKNLKSCFRKLNQLIIEEPKLGTKQIIIMVAEYFPKLKSLVFRCKNEFDWELGKLFEKKMGQLVRFQVNDGQNKNEHYYQ